MIKTRTINEINRSVLEICCDESKLVYDYKLKMIDYNEMPSFLKKTTRHIDGCEKELFDISGKENIISYFNLRVADRDELIKLFDAMVTAKDEAEKLLIEEGNILFRPDCIFLDSRTMNYCFICLPMIDPEERLRENMHILLQFFLTRIDDNDIPLLKTIYSLFDRQQSANLSSRAIRDMLISGIKENEPKELYKEFDESKTQEMVTKSEDKHLSYYVPSLKEILAVSCVGVGMILIGLHLYDLML